MAQAIVVTLALFGHWTTLLVGVLLMAPMGLDWALQYRGILSSTNTRRSVTGILGGAGYATICVNAFVALVTHFA